MCCGIIISAKHQRDEIMIKVTLTNDILKKISVIDENRFSVRSVDQINKQWIVSMESIR